MPILTPLWWNQRTKLERTLCFVTVTTVLMLSVLAVTLTVSEYLNQKNVDARQSVSNRSNSARLVSRNGSSETNLCLTPECVRAAAYILSSMDESADPCEDFYQFSCGGWLERHSIPEDKSSVSVFSELQDEVDLKLKALLDKKLDGSEPESVQLIKEMYDSCVDLKSLESVGSEPLQTVLKSFGGWPVVEGDEWDDSKFDWIDALISFRRLGYSHDILMALRVIVDNKNNTKHVIELDQASLGVPDRSYLVHGLNDTTTAAYFKMMEKAAQKLGVDPQGAEDELKEALNFEMALAKYSLPREERRNFSRLYNKYTVKKLAELVPTINWMKYLNGLLDHPITEDETLIVSVPDFIIRFADLMLETDKRVVANYMMWRLTFQTLSVLSKEWRELVKEYSAVLKGKNQDRPRWEECLDFQHRNLPIALGSLYVRHYFRDWSKDPAMELVKYISNEFRNILDDLDWMDKGTKKQAMGKAKSIKTYIAYPQEILNNTLVMEQYENLTITNESYYDNIMRLRKWSVDYAFSQLRKPNVKGQWNEHAWSAIVNAFYDPLENSIDFPAGILQSPFFNKNCPHYLNFGTIGYIIGHEITHGFDDTGRQFDKDGNNVNWWADSTDQRFKEKARCIIEQYGNYTVENGMQLNGVNTQGENIADNGGLKEAYLAYRTWVKDHGPEPLLPGLKYTSNQLFFIGAANSYCSKWRPEFSKLMIKTGSHSPDRFRVIGPMSNLPEFAEEFKCKIGTKMNPEHKCQVW